MSDTIATVGSVAVVAGGGPPRPPLPGEAARPRETAPAGNSGALSVPETRAVARHEMETQGRYQIRIHAETMRMITEVIDMFTGDVLMYLPPGYRPDAKAEADAETAP
jgi:hypothetical protein